MFHKIMGLALVVIGLFMMYLTMISAHALAAVRAGTFPDVESVLGAVAGLIGFLYGLKIAVTREDSQH